jgi:flagellar protein FlgJ
MEMINQRRLALPPKLADRLLAGLVPSATPTVANNSCRNALPPRIRSRDIHRFRPAVQRRLAGTGRGGKIFRWADAGLWPCHGADSTGAGEESVQFRRRIRQHHAADGQGSGRRIGVDPRYLVAQAALETGWGKSVMRAQDGSSSHNLFGIKASSNWKGDSARAITSEFRDGQMVKETAEFRSYASYKDSFHDLVTLLQSNNRYQDVVKSADNPEQFVRELQKAGYATDPNYATKISQIAKQMNSFENYAAAGVSTTPL